MRIQPAEVKPFFKVGSSFVARNYFGVVVSEIRSRSKAIGLVYTFNTRLIVHFPFEILSSGFIAVLNILHRNSC